MSAPNPGFARPPEGVQENLGTARRFPEGGVAYRPDIDGLRALAVLPVVLFHVDPALMPGGFLGVDVFFVISGYLISLILYRELRDGTFSLADFYARRVRRLFPALIVVLLATLAFGYFALQAQEYLKLARQAASAIFFVMNLRLIGEAGYFDVATYFKPLLHLWSLSVEEQFYLVWPALLWLLHRRRFPLGAGVLVLAVLSLVYCVWLVRVDPDAAYYHPVSRFWELLAGAIVARVHFSQGPRWLRQVLQRERLRGLLAMLGLLLIVSAMFLFHPAIPHPGLATLWPIAGVVLVILCGPQTAASRWLGTPVLVGIGLISYPLYLWHWPLLSYVRIMESGRPDALFLWLAAALALLLAWGTYRWVELPLRQARDRRGSLRLLLLGMVAALTSAIAIAAESGMPERPALQYEKAFLRDMQRSARQDASCLALLHGAAAPVYCRQNMAGPRMVALIGDSHAHALFEGVAELAQKRGYGTLLLANSGCPPLLGTTWGRTAVAWAQCERDIEQILRTVSQDSRVVSVLIATRGPIYIEGTGFGPAEAGYNTPPILAAGSDPATAHADPARLFADGLLRTAGRLEGAGKRVAYLLQVPELGVAVSECIGRPLALTRERSSCEVPYRVYAARMQGYRKLVQELAHNAPMLHLVDVESAYCNAGVCSGVQGRQLLYADGNHPSLSGARAIAPRLLAQLLPDPAPGQARAGK